MLDGIDRFPQSPAPLWWCVTRPSIGRCSRHAALRRALHNLRLPRHGRAAYDIAELLLHHGVPVDGPAPHDRSPLQAFAHQGDHKTVAWLLAHGADVNARNSTGRTAVHYAAERNTNPKTLALLAENGADLKARDSDGQTPLEIARRNGKRRLVDWPARNAQALRSM